jgi:hypothetical protein
MAERNLLKQSPPVVNRTRAVREAEVDQAERVSAPPRL